MDYGLCDIAPPSNRAAINPLSGQSLGKALAQMADRDESAAVAGNKTKTTSNIISKPMYSIIILIVIKYFLFSYSHTLQSIDAFRKIEHINST
jgi:hypothetical protein